MATLNPWVLSVQHALADHGFDPGPDDGVLGRLTRGAIIAFQRAHGLTPDGIVGRNTAPLLFAGPAQNTQARAATGATPQLIAPWYIEAERLRGTREVTGRGSNPLILDWADNLGMDSYSDDDIPWCGLFVAHCLAVSLPEEPLPNSILLARAWQHFGRPISPREGSVLVFWRGKRSGWSGHVGFYAGEDASTYHVLGGNQSNAVNIARISKARLLATRWPATAQQADTRSGMSHSDVATAQSLSTNEA